MKPPVRLLGFFTFFVLLVLALAFYKERTITYDMSFQEFYIIITKSFVLNLRIGAAIPQIIPLLLRWLNFPLKAILILHSAGFVLFYFAFFCVIAFGLRQYAPALVLLLSGLLLVNDTFYWIQSELPQGLAWLILYYAYIEKKGPGDISRRPWLHFPMLLFLQFFHPLIFVPILFVVLFSIYQRYKFNLAFYGWPLVIVWVNFGIRIWISRFDAYESSKLNVDGVFKKAELFRNFFNGGANVIVILVAVLALLLLVFAVWRRLYLVAFVLLTAGTIYLAQLLAPNVPSIAQVTSFSGSDYLIFWIVFFFVMLTLIANGRIYMGALLASFTAVYLFLICVATPHADKFYLENMMLPLGIFVLLPFANIIVSGFFPSQKIATGLLVAIIAIRLAFIFDTHKIYARRLEWYYHKFEVMDRTKQQRLMVQENSAIKDTLIMTWATSYESVILSSVEGPEHTKSIIVDNDLSNYRGNLEHNNLLSVKFGGYTTDQLPYNYFSLRDGVYVIM